MRFLLQPEEHIYYWSMSCAKGAMRWISLNRPKVSENSRINCCVAVGSLLIFRSSKKSSSFIIPKRGLRGHDCPASNLLFCWSYTCVSYVAYLTCLFHSMAWRALKGKLCRGCRTSCIFADWIYSPERARRFVLSDFHWKSKDCSCCWSRVP